MWDTDTLEGMAVAAIILAAGGSRRLGRPKQLVMFQGETLLGRAVRLADAAGAQPVVVVVGAHAASIRQAVPEGAALVAVNADWEQGMASSIHAGLRTLAAHALEVEGVLLMGCDQPRLTESHLRALLDAFAAGGGSGMAASFYAGRRGVPAVMPRSMFTRLLALRGDQGARALLAEASCPVVDVTFAGGEADIDEPDDLTLLT